MDVPQDRLEVLTFAELRKEVEEFVKSLNTNRPDADRKVIARLYNLLVTVRDCRRTGEPLPFPRT